MVKVLSERLKEADLSDADIASYEAATKAAWAKWEQERPEWVHKVMILVLLHNGFAGAQGALVINVGINPPFGSVPANIHSPGEIEVALLTFLRDRWPEGSPELA